MDEFYYSIFNESIFPSFFLTTSMKILSKLKIFIEVTKINFHYLSEVLSKLKTSLKQQIFFTFSVKLWASSKFHWKNNFYYLNVDFKQAWNQHWDNKIFRRKSYHLSSVSSKLETELNWQIKF